MFPAPQPPMFPAPQPPHFPIFYLHQGVVGPQHPNIQFGIVQYQNGVADNCLFHFYDANTSPARWHDFVVKYPFPFFLKILGVHDHIYPPIMFTEYSRQTLHHWFQNNNHLTRVDRFGRLHMSDELASYLGKVLEGLHHMWFSLGSSHGDIRATNLFLVDPDLIKLGPGLGIGNLDLNVDFTGLHAMITALGLIHIPNMIPFFEGFLPNPQRQDSLRINTAYHAYANPLFKPSATDKLRYREAVETTLQTLRDQNALTYNCVQQQMQARLPAKDWVVDLQANPISNCYSAILTFRSVKPVYSSADSLSFCRFGRNFNVHRDKSVLTDEEAEDGLQSIYSCYIQILHQLLSELNIKVVL